MEARLRLPSLDLVLQLGLFAASVWLVIASELSRSDLPSKTAWKPGEPLFYSVIGAGVYVAGVAFYTYVLTRKSARSKREADISRICQRIAWQIVKASRQVDPTKLAVGIWLCRQKGGFDRRFRFLLAGERPSSPITWRHGLGVAGSLWASTEEPDRLEKLTVRNGLDSTAFGQLPEEERLGLSFLQWKSVSKYTGVIAVKLVHDTGTKKKLVGFLVIDYRGGLTRSGNGLDELDCIGKAVGNDDVAELRGGLVTLLGTRA